MSIGSTSVLLLDDDRLFAETLADFLSEEGYDVDMVLDPYSAQDKSFSRRYDLYLFDINLPFESGLELLKKLRDGEDNTPTIFLTSREDKESLVDGLDMGADDYLRKPVDLDELRSRIRAVLRRRDGAEIVRIGGYEMDTIAKRLYSRSGEEIELGKRLFDLLHMLVSANGQTVTTENIMMELWPRDKEASYGALRVYVTRLKKIFGSKIENIRGIGYRFVERAEDG
jgi:DNA-binding response OmpR family regulator